MTAPEPLPWSDHEIWGEIADTVVDHDELPPPVALSLHPELTPPHVRLTMRNADEVQAWAALLGAKVYQEPTFGLREHLVSLVQVDDWGGSGWMLVVRYAQPVAAEAVAE